MSRVTSFHKVSGPLTIPRAEVLVERLTKALVELKDEQDLHSSEGSTGVKHDSKTWAGWDWPQGVALTVLYQHYLLDPSSKGSQLSLKTAVEWFEAQWELTSGSGAPKHVNSMAAMYCLASLLQDGKIEDTDGKWIKWCTEWAEWIMNDMPRTVDGGFQHIVHDKENKDQLWDDTLFMAVLPLTRIGLLLDRTEYIQEAAYQLVLHMKYLSDPYTGLWTHGWQFQGESGGHHFAKSFWARGNAWVVYGIPLFLEIAGDVLPEDDPARRMVVNEYKRLVNALAPLQDTRTGLWHTLLDDRTTYLETSASAGIAAGIFAGVRLGVLSARKYLPMANAALVGVTGKILPNGEVDGVSSVTPMGEDFTHYREIPITPMPYGQALVMAALVEWERLYALDEAPHKHSSTIPGSPVSPVTPTSPVSPVSPVSPISPTSPTAPPILRQYTAPLDLPGRYPTEHEIREREEAERRSREPTATAESPAEPVMDHTLSTQFGRTVAVIEPGGNEDSVPGGSILAQVENARNQETQ
ncbi:glycosyl hydrolase family 88-domain-containing protein [Kockovaella imperatae]|uniref:Glycosyl hydrolase family 88-domain-containing protein n=1 Tax=Kockovaella imperatae TaxID=4999 RepID=A0A1Y1USA2_9TREE|nr:glycosyl hydrolase family 88-domain-containing protein [Kockovaella imperatae]ORX40901.1 glycosyl hydrolase family 88-domain-containing protein [Kockovaella imperatae]